MSTLEQEIVEKFHQLPPAAKRRVQALIEQVLGSEFDEAGTAAFDYATWARAVETLRQQIRASHGDKLPSMDVVTMLRAIRDGEDE